MRKPTQQNLAEQQAAYGTVINACENAGHERYVGYPCAPCIVAVLAERDALREAAQKAEQVLLRCGERKAASWLHHALAAGKGKKP